MGLQWDSKHGRTYVILHWPTFTFSTFILQTLITDALLSYIWHCNKFKLDRTMISVLQPLESEALVFIIHNICGDRRGGFYCKEVIVNDSCL